MKIPMFIAVTGVLAALVVPMASGSIDRSLPWDTTIQQSTHHQQLSKKLKSAGTKVTKVTTVPAAPLGGMLPDPSVADCTSFGGNCTALEYCELWGTNCPAMTPDSSTFAESGSPANP